MFQTARAFLQQLRGVADIRPIHPSWWGPFFALALRPEASRTLGDGTPHSYRNANGGPAADTFIARPTTPLPGAAECVARAVGRARRALDALSKLDGTHEDQPLLRHLVVERGWVHTAAFPGAERRVAFVLPGRVLVTSLVVGDETRVAAELATVVAGGTPPSATWTEIDVDSTEPTLAAVAVGLFPTPLAAARHLHRRAWTRGGGPWLGISDSKDCDSKDYGSGELGVASTCHVAIDGQGHLQVTLAVLGAADEQVDDRGPLVLATRAHLDSRPAIPDRASEWVDDTFGFAARILPAASFRHQAYSFGRALEFFMMAAGQGPEAGPRRSGFTTVFQVPVVPGRRGDPTRATRRARHALMSLKVEDDRLESFDSFSRRIPSLLAAEREGYGAIAELAASVAHVPFPRALRQRFLRTHRNPSPRLPSQEVLSGRGRLSSMVLAPDDQGDTPLYAASAPSLVATPRDPRGSLVLTVIRHSGHQCTASVFGTGLVSTTEGAEHFLDVWCEELEQVTR